MKPFNGMIKERINIGDVFEIRMKIMGFSGILETQDTTMRGKMLNFYTSIKGPRARK